MAEKKFKLVVPLSLVFAIPAFCAPAEHSEIITVNDYTYEIEVGGFRDPVNETIIIEHLGGQPVVNPRITVNRSYDWYDVETIAREATRGCSTDEERALALLEFVRTNFHHMGSPGDREIHNPVVALNVYGYANCAYHASVFVSLARALGMKARVWEVWHHTVSEIWYNNAWHMLDSDIGLTYLMDDNRTVASIPQLWEDQKITGGKEESANLSKFSGRNKAIHIVYEDVEGNNAFVSQDGIKQRGYRYFHDDYHSYVQTGYDRFTYEPHSMAMTLRPGEKLVRNWKGGAKFYDYRRRNALFERTKSPESKPILYGDGQLIWKPDLRSENARLYLNQEQPPAFAFEDGQEPALHVKYRQGGVYNVPTRAIFAVETPYTIVGGRLKATVYRGAATNWDRVSATLKSRTGPVSERLWRAPEDAVGSIDLDVSLDEVFYPSGERGRRDYTVEFNFTASEKNDPPTQSGVESVEMITDIQCAPRSLPALNLGRNIIRYRDETPGPHKVKITHIWRERTDNHPPTPPRKAAYPPHGEVVGDLAPLFRWAAAADADKADRIADHWIKISFDPQCRWPVATALQKVTGSGKPEWQIPPGWLNRDTTYYWQVKAKDSRGIWGEWGPVFRFSTR